MRLLDLNERFSSPIIVSYRRNDGSTLLRQLLKLMQKLKDKA